MNYFNKFENHPKKKGYVFGFIKYLRIIKDGGLGKLNRPNQWNSWLEGKQKDRFFELKKGRERISFYDYPENSKLLIISQFIKKKMKAKKEYKRSINLRKKFDNKPIWIEEKGAEIK